MRVQLITSWVRQTHPQLAQTLWTPQKAGSKLISQRILAKAEDISISIDTFVQEVEGEEFIIIQSLYSVILVIFNKNT